MQKDNNIFQLGDNVQCNDAKNNHWTFILNQDDFAHTHKGKVSHNDIIGMPYGSTIKSVTGHELTIFKPSTNDYILGMDRGPTIIYPKDCASIISELDIKPTSNILESGVGSGGLSIEILKHLSNQEGGSLTSVEIDPMFAKVASQNVSNFFKTKPNNWNLIVSDFQDFDNISKDSNIILPIKYDGIVLDMLKPWEMIEKCYQILGNGKPLIMYITTTTQMKECFDSLRKSEKFEEPEIYELSRRHWHIDGLSVRPSHKEPGFSGFIIRTRKMAEGYTMLKKRGKAKLSNQDDKQVESFESLQKDIPARKIRKILNN